MKKKKEQSQELARVTMKLPQELWDAVQHRAIDEHTTLSELVSKALAEYLKKGARP